MLRTGFAVAVALTIGAALPAFAEPAVVMAPGGPGGGYDAMARLPFDAMEKEGIFTDGASFVNKGGAGGTIGLAEFVSSNTGNDNAVMSMGVILIGGILLNGSPVTMDDVTPLVRLTNDTGVIAVATDSPINTVADLVAAMKADLGAVPVGGGSAGGVDHIVMALLAKENGLDPSAVNYIPYDSGAETVTSLGGGTLAVAVSGLSEFKPMADAGRIRIIAVTSAERLPGVDAPTLKESGSDVVVGNWRGIVGAKDMSDAGRQMWLDRFTKMHESATWQETLAKQGWEDAFLAGDEFVTFLGEERSRVEAVLKDVGLVK